MSAAGERLRERGPLALVVVVLVAASARLFAMIDAHAVDVLFWDQWDLMVPLMEDANAWELFRFQHGPHRQGLGFWLTAAVAEASAWSTRAEAFAIGIVLVVATLAALALRLRLAGRLAWIDAAIPLLLLTPAQYGIFAHTPNVSHGAMPLLLLVLFARSLLVEDWRLRFALLLGLEALLVHTGFGLFVGGLAPLHFGLEAWRARRAGAGGPAPIAAIGALVLSLAIAGSFLVDYHFDPAVPGFEVRLDQLLGHPRYVVLMAANVLGVKGTGALATSVGTIVLVIVVGVSLWHLRAIARDEARPESEVVLLFAAFGLLFGLTTAVGRYALGLPTAQATRYVPLVAPLFLALIVAAGALGGSVARRVVGAVAVGVLLAATVPMRAPEARFMASLSARKTRWVETYRATHDIGAADRAARLKIYPWPPERTRLREKLDFLEARGLSLFATSDVDRRIHLQRLESGDRPHPEPDSD